MHDVADVSHHRKFAQETRQKMVSHICGSLSKCCELGNPRCHQQITINNTIKYVNNRGLLCQLC